MPDWFWILMISPLVGALVANQLYQRAEMKQLRHQNRQIFKRWYETMDDYVEFGQRLDSIEKQLRTAKRLEWEGLDLKQALDAAGYQILASTVGTEGDGRVWLRPLDRAVDITQPHSSTIGEADDG